MRAFLIRFRWLIVGVLTIVLVAAALAVDASRARRDASAPVAQPRENRELQAYRGLASWVDRWDEAAWRDPSAVVQNMAQTRASPTRPRCPSSSPRPTPETCSWSRGTCRR